MPCPAWWSHIRSCSLVPARSRFVCLVHSGKVFADALPESFGRPEATFHS